MSSNETRIPAEPISDMILAASAIWDSETGIILTCSGVIQVSRYPGFPDLSIATAVSSSVYSHLSMEPITAQCSITGYCFSPFSSL